MEPIPDSLRMFKIMHGSRRSFRSRRSGGMQNLNQSKSSLKVCCHDGTMKQKEESCAMIMIGGVCQDAETDAKVWLNLFLLGFLLLRRFLLLLLHCVGDLGSLTY